MDSELALWAAKLELECLDNKETSLALVEELTKISGDLKQHLSKVNVNLNKLKHSNSCFSELIVSEVEKHTAMMLEDLDIRLARCTRKIKDYFSQLKVIESSMNDQESVLESINHRLSAVEKFVATAEHEKHTELSNKSDGIQNSHVNKESHATTITLNTNTNVKKQKIDKRSITLAAPTLKPNNGKRRRLLFD